MTLALPGTGPMILPTDTVLAASPTPADLDTKKLATMDLFGVSLTANGYQKLPSGLIIQWGDAASTGTLASGAGATAPVTFPVVFPNQVFRVVCTNLSQMINSAPASITNSGFTMNSLNVSSTTGAGPSYWLAIGY